MHSGVKMEKKKPKVAILGGTGNEGPGLAMRWAVAGYPIIIGSRVLERAQTTASDLNEQLDGVNIMGLINADAAKMADICVLTVVQSAHQLAVSGLKDELQGKSLSMLRQEWSSGIQNHPHPHQLPKPHKRFWVPA